MSPNLDDRRVQRTRDLLRQAMIDLLPSKGYSTISIQDLTDQANLGKATFYLHYRDKDELLYDCMEMILSTLANRIAALPSFSWSSHDPRPVELAFEFANEHARFLKVMLRDPGGLIFFQKLHTIVAGMILKVIREESDARGSKPLVPLEFLSTYFAGSILAAVEWWVDDQHQIPPGEMVEMVSKTSTLSRKELLGWKS